MQPGKKLFVKEIQSHKHVPSFGESDDNTTSNQTTKAVDKALANGCDSPYKHDEGKPIGWFEFLDEDVGWNLKKNVRNEEDEKGDVILISMHSEIFFQSLNTSISN
jgi:hypothetical protein